MCWGEGGGEGRVEKFLALLIMLGQFCVCDIICAEEFLTLLTMITLSHAVVRQFKLP